MPRHGALEKTVPTFTLIGERRKAKDIFNKGEWSQEVDVAGTRYRVRIIRGRRVRVAYSAKWGNKWYGEIYNVASSKRIWDAEIPGSLGVRGMLLDAGLVQLPSKWWDHFLRSWHLLGRACHGTCHPECRPQKAAATISPDSRLARDHTTPGQRCRRLCEHEWPDARWLKADEVFCVKCGTQKTSK